MKKLNVIICFLLIIFSVSSYADLDDKVLISGKIGNAFDKEKVKVIDSHNQTYYLPRSVFSKNFVPKQDESFSVEINVQQFKELEIEK